MNRRIPTFFSVRIPIVLAGSLLLSTAFLKAQDIHFTQFYAAPMNISPGLVGVYPGDIRLMTNFRSQWHSVPVDYRTFTLAAETKLCNPEYNRRFFTLGMAFNYDQAGVSLLNFTNLSVTGSYTQRMANKLYATAGVQLGATQRRFRTKGLVFDTQYDPLTGEADPLLPTQEDFSNRRNFYGDLAAGLNIRFQTRDDEELVDPLEKRTKIDAGFGIYHLNTPLQNFIEDDFSEIDLPVRFSPYLLATLQVGNSFDILANVMLQSQGSYRQLLTGLGARLHLNRQPGRQLAIQFVANYRSYDFEEALAPSFGVSYNNWRAGFSYDVNISEFNVATRSRSGPELFIHYTIGRVNHCVLPVKICPLI